MSEIPIREMTRNAVKALGGKVNNAQIIEWVTKNYGEKNNGTLRAQIISCSVNQPSRVYYPENSKPRESDPRYDFFYSTGRGEVELFDIKKHGNWGIREQNGKSRITHEGKIVDKLDSNEFFFIEKDFESFTGIKEDHASLFSRFGILKSILENTLGGSFEDSNSNVGKYWERGKKNSYKNFQWLGFDRKNTSGHNIFQVSINNPVNLSIMVWIDSASGKEFKKIISEQINNNQEKFIELLRKLPPFYHIGIQNKDEEPNEIQVADGISSEFIDIIKNNIDKNNYHLYIARKYSKNEAIQLGTKIVDEISNIFETLIPISDFLLTSNTEVTMSPLLKFLKKEITMQANYQPIIIKTLLEQGNDKGFSTSLDKIKEKIKVLNFDRNFNMTDTINAVSGALSKYVTFGDDVSLHLDSFSSSEIPECLKICGQRIAKWHLDNIVEKKYDMWHIMPGSSSENFPYLNEFLKTNSIGIGWDKIKNISNLSEEELKEKFIESYENDNAFQGFLDFTKIKQKDIVVLTKAQQEITDFGIVVGDYEFKDIVKPSYPHRKQVVWLNQGPISPEELSNPTLAGFMATCGKLVKRKQEMISVLLGKNTMSAIKAHSCFILTQYSDSKYDDVEGKQYQYDNQKPNSRKLLEGSKFIIQSKINNENGFVGYGKIESITESSDTNEKGKPITKFVAKFSVYNKFDPPKMRTDDIYAEMKSQKAYGSQPPSILPITRQLYKKITGQDLGEDKEEIVGMETDYSRTVNILKRKKNIILYGPPGTGKTYTAKKIAKILTNQANSRHTWNSVTTLVLIENFGKSLNYHKIAKKAIEKNLVKTKGQTPEETIAKNIRNDIEKLGNESFFKKTEEAMYGLNIPTTFSKAAEMILFAYNKPMKSIEIAEIAHKQKLIDSIGETPERTMSTELIRNIENNGDNSTFVKVNEGMYELRKQNPHTDNDEQLIENVTFHQSYGYEEFIESIRPTPIDNGITYTVEPGIFQEFCKKASENQEQDYVIIIDEINRGNISKIFGELITIIEKDKRGIPVTLAYSKKSFNVPENIFVIGTMNTADQSLTHMDAALKRRFSLVEVMPNPSLLKTTKSGVSLGILLEKLNDRIIMNGSRDNQIGHSYFMEDGESIDSTKNLQFVFATDIIPLLRDYFYDDENSLKEILGEQFIDWGNPHRDMKEDWQDDPQVFLNTLKNAFGIQIDSN